MNHSLQGTLTPLEQARKYCIEQGGYFHDSFEKYGLLAFGDKATFSCVADRV